MDSTTEQLRELRRELQAGFSTLSKRISQLERQQSAANKRTSRQIESVSDALVWQQFINDAILCGVCLALSFGIKGIDYAKQNVCPQLPGWASAAVPFNFCGGSSDAAPTSWEPLFDGGPNSLVAIAIGNAEGTRTPDGGKTAAFVSHPDPGNGVENQGTFSYQHGAASPQAADQKQLERLHGQMAEVAPQLSRKDMVTWLNLADLLNQSPAAGQNFPKYLQQCNGDILCARVKSYEGDAPGITRNGITIEEDQRRRMGEIAKVIAQKQSALTTITAGEGSKTGWINPAPRAEFTSGFGFRVHPISKHTRCHYGIDLAAATGTPILAAKSGTVEVAGDKDDGFGLKIVLKHSDGSKSLYAHLSKINVSVGQQVEQGDAIGLMGSTGNSTGPHLHWEVDTGNGVIDPYPLLPEKPPGSQTFGKIDQQTHCMDKRL